MKYLKMIGLAAVAAMALMAFAGAGTASASVLCTATETPCSAAKKISPTNDSEMVATLTGSAVLEEDPGNVIATCTASEMVADSTAAGSKTETAVGKITKLTWGGCSTTVDNVALGSLEVHHIPGTDNGTVTSIGTEVTLNLFGVSCTLKGTDLGTITGGTSPVMDVTATVDLTVGSFLCPEHALWTATYNITKPKPLYSEPE